MFKRIKKYLDDRYQRKLNKKPNYFVYHAGVDVAYIKASDEYHLDLYLKQAERYLMKSTRIEIDYKEHHYTIEGGL